MKRIEENEVEEEKEGRSVEGEEDMYMGKGRKKKRRRGKKRKEGKRTIIIIYYLTKLPSKFIVIRDALNG